MVDELLIRKALETAVGAIQLAGRHERALDDVLRELGYGMAVLYLFTTAIHSGALGALLTFTTTLWYPAYADTTMLWGLTPIEDQQLGGLIMWVPAGLVYIAAGLALFIGWLTESERRALVHDAQWLATHPPQTSPAAATNAGGMP